MTEFASHTHPSSISAWLEAMRPRTLPVSIAGVCGGTACAIFLGGFSWLPCVICFIFAICAQIVSNFANEYYDYANGLDKSGREGFRRGVTEGDIAPKAMKRATYGLLVLTCLIGCTLIFWGGWWLIGVGAAIAVCALAYSAGPYPLSHHGLGDIAVILFFGIVPVTLTCYVQTQSFDYLSFTFCIGSAIGMLAANVLIVNNYRDMEEDKSVGKHTTVVFFGRNFMSIVYLLFSLGALLIIASATYYRRSALWLIAWCVWAVIYIILFAMLRSRRGKALNALLKYTSLTMLGVCTTLILESLI